MGINKVKIARIKQGLTQTELGKKTGIGLNSIVKIEKDEVDTIKLGTLKKIAAALNTTVQELFF